MLSVELEVAGLVQIFVFASATCGLSVTSNPSWDLDGWGCNPVKMVSQNFTKSLYGNVFFEITTKMTVKWGYRGKTTVLPW